MEHLSNLIIAVSDLTKPEVDSAQTCSCLYTGFLTKQPTVPVTDVMKLDLKPLESDSNFRKPKHSRMDFGRICICCFFSD